MTRRDTAQEIEIRSAQWAARIEAGPLSEAEEEELTAWLACDTRHAGAYARARAIGYYADRAAALGSAFDPKCFERDRPANTRSSAGFSRRQLVCGGSALVASIGVATIAGLVFSPFGVTYASDRGQMRVVSLADGSVVNLNTDSRIRVRLTPQRRDIWLEQGEALFEVAKDKARPFVVRAGDLQVQALGTSFVVQRLTDRPVEVLVREGVVEVDRGRGEPGVRMNANMRATSPGHPPVAKAAPIAIAYLAPHELERTTAWLDGRIAFEGETLQQAASEFSRYSEVSIIIDDPVIANERITGLYQTVDPVGFAKSMAVIFELKTAISEKQIRLYR